MRAIFIVYLFIRCIVLYFALGFSFCSSLAGLSLVATIAINFGCVTKRTGYVFHIKLFPTRFVSQIVGNNESQPFIFFRSSCNLFVSNIRCTIRNPQKSSHSYCFEELCKSAKNKL